MASSRLTVGESSLFRGKPNADGDDEQEGEQGLSHRRIIGPFTALHLRIRKPAISLLGDAESFALDAVHSGPLREGPRLGLRETVPVDRPGAEFVSRPASSPRASPTRGRC